VHAEQDRYVSRHWASYLVGAHIGVHRDDDRVCMRMRDGSFSMRAKDVGQHVLAALAVERFYTALLCLWPLKKSSFKRRGNRIPRCGELSSRGMIVLEVAVVPQRNRNRSSS
jgi:hypothetical protein